MDKTLDLDELEKDAHGVLAYHNPSDPTPRVGVRATVLLALIAAARPAGINTPDMPGQFEGDIWFGDPVKRNLGTHRWENGEWVLLPSELESVLELLAVRTAQRDAALSAARPAVTTTAILAARSWYKTRSTGHSPSTIDAGECDKNSEVIGFTAGYTQALAARPAGVVPDREAIVRAPWRQTSGFYTDDSQHRWRAIEADEDNARQGIYRRKAAADAKADTIIAMLSAPAVPDGYVLVPREPTEAMVNAVWHHWLHGMGHSQECMRDALRAMLSASPKEVSHER